MTTETAEKTIATSELLARVREDIVSGTATWELREELRQAIYRGEVSPMQLFELTKLAGGHLALTPPAPGGPPHDAGHAAVASAAFTPAPAPTEGTP